MKTDLRQDLLHKLNKNVLLQQKIIVIHDAVQIFFPFIERIAIVLYDNKTEMLKTYLASSKGIVPLKYYDTKLGNAASLKKIKDTGNPRVVNDLDVFDDGKHEHTIQIKKHGYNSSYTFPMYHDNNFFGFIFYNSFRKNCFSEEVLNVLDIFSHLIISLTIYELTNFKTMLAALRTANEMVHVKDPETGNHLERMSRFSRIIAKHLAQSGKHQFDDKYIEDIFVFAPMHDVGKIAIPDHVLLKPSSLNEEELDTMRTHADRGRQIVDSIIRNFEFESFGHIDILRNIAEYHHETLDGTGYPKGLKGDDIPIEARIIAVADIFDALTSDRPYKSAWSNSEAFHMLKKLAQNKLDSDCVEALIKHEEEVREIQRSFREPVN